MHVQADWRSSFGRCRSSRPALTDNIRYVEFVRRFVHASSDRWNASSFSLPFPSSWRTLSLSQTNNTSFQISNFFIYDEQLFAQTVLQWLLNNASPKCVGWPSVKLLYTSPNIVQPGRHDTSQVSVVHLAARGPDPTSGVVWSGPPVDFRKQKN